MKRLLAIPLMAATILAARGIRPMPLHPDFVAELKASGRLLEVTEVWKEFQQTNLYSLPAPAEPVTSGSGIAILVDFEDNEADTINHPPAEYDTLLFSVGLKESGSMKDFYIENSYGQFEFSGEPSPHPDSGRSWHRLEGSYDYWSEYYGFAHSRELAQEAVKAADPFVDFARFDNDGPDGLPNSGDDDGYIDAVYVVHAGPGYEENHCGAIWSHMSVTYLETQDNSANGGKIALRRYSVQPEERCSGALINMGVFAHEYGHILGLPDLYDYDYDAAGVGRWSLMAAGSWNGGGASPAHFDAWCKSQLGWVQPDVVTDYKVDAELAASEFSPAVYRLWTDGDSTSRQYFLAENRQRMGLFDSKLPGAGLLIYHVDEAKNSNDDQYIPGVHSAYHHYRVAVEQADGNFNLERNANSGDYGDPFPGTSGRREFYTHLPYPTSRDYYEEETKVGVLNVSNSDSLMYADLDVGKNLPYLRLVSVSQETDDDGRIEAGEQGSVILAVENLWGTGEEVEAEISISHPQVTVLEPLSDFGQIAEEESKSNEADPFILEVSADAPGYLKIDAQVVFTEQTTGYTQSFTFPLVIGWPGLLVVNDAGDEKLDTDYQEILDNVGVPYEQATSQDLTVLRDMLLAQDTHDSVLVWFTGKQSATLDAEEIELLGDFLASGGKLILSSQNLGEDIGTTGFYTDTLLARYQSPDQTDVVIYGTGDHLLAQKDEIIGIDLAYSSSRDGIAARQGASEVFAYSTSDNAGMIASENDAWQIAYMSFPLEGLTGNPNMVVTAEELTARVLSWFGYQLGIAEDEEITRTFEMRMLSTVLKAGENAVLKITMPGKGGVNISLYDALGRRLSHIPAGELNQGTHRFSISTKGLSPGVYFVRGTAENTQQTERLLILN